MDEKEIQVKGAITEVIDILNDMDMWFTTKNDPTFEEASNYYELDEYGFPTSKASEQILSDIQQYIGDGAVEFTDAIDMWITECLQSYKIDYKDNLVTKFKNKPVVDGIDAFINPVQLTEGRKSRLNEENNKSAELISAKFTDSSFDSDSKEGQIIIRTSELFNALSDKGYDVQVTFDNGESQNVVLLGNTGGSVIITIINNTEPLKAYSSGNYEITDEIIETLTDIKNEISAL